MSEIRVDMQVGSEVTVAAICAELYRQGIVFEAVQGINCWLIRFYGS